MEEQEIPNGIKLEYTGEIRQGVEGEYYYDYEGNFKLVTKYGTQYKWPIYRVVEEEQS